MRLAATITILLAVVGWLAAGCSSASSSNTSSSATVPSSVEATLSAEEAWPETQLAINLWAHAGGGCNVDGPYQLDTSLDMSDSKVLLTVRGHSYESDGGPCAEVAEAVSDVMLPSLEVDASYQLEIQLANQVNAYTVERRTDRVVVTEMAASNVSLTCSDGGLLVVCE